MLTLCIFACWEIEHALLLSANFFSELTFIKKIFQEYYIRVSNSLDPDQTPHFVWPDLGQNCL